MLIHVLNSACLLLKSFIALSGVQLVQGEFIARERFGYVDSGCDPYMDYLDKGTQDVIDLSYAALDNLSTVVDATNRGVEASALLAYTTFASYWGVDKGDVQDPRVVHAGYAKIVRHLARRPIITHLIFCNSSVFEWHSDNDGSPLTAERGHFRTKPERVPWGFPPIQFVSYNSPQRNGDLCLDQNGKRSQAVDLSIALHGIPITVFCPLAFEKPVQLDRKQQEEGTELDFLVSFGTLFLHELTHALLDTGDYYDDGGPLEVANTSPELALKNADNWMYYGMACLLNLNAWVYMVAEPLALWFSIPPAPLKRRMLDVRRDEPSHPSGDDAGLIKHNRPAGIEASKARHALVRRQQSTALPIEGCVLDATPTICASPTSAKAPRASITSIVAAELAQISVLATFTTA